MVRFGHRHDQFYKGDIQLCQAVPLWQVPDTWAFFCPEDADVVQDRHGDRNLWVAKFLGSPSRSSSLFLSRPEPSGLHMLVLLPFSLLRFWKSCNTRQPSWHARQVKCQTLVCQWICGHSWLALRLSCWSAACGNTMAEGGWVRTQPSSVMCVQSRLLDPSSVWSALHKPSYHTRGCKPEPSAIFVVSFL